MRLWHGLARPALKFALAAWLAPALAVADVAFVTCQNGDAVSVLDLDSGAEVARWSVPGQPAGVAVSKSGIVYTVSPDSKTVRRHDKHGSVSASAVLPGGPIGIALDPRGDWVFVSDWYNARIWALAADDLSMVAELPTGAAPAGLALSPDGRLLASADRDADQVSLFSTDTLALRRTVPVGTRPFGLRFAPDGRLFVGNVGSNDVTVVDPEAGAVSATVPVGERPYGIAFAAGRAFVTNQYEDTVTVLSLDDLSEVAVIDVGEYPEGIDTTPDGRHIVLANWFENTVTVIDPTALSVLRTIGTADGPRAFGTFVSEGGQ